MARSNNDSNKPKGCPLSPASPKSIHRNQARNQVRGHVKKEIVRNSQDLSGGDLLKNPPPPKP